MDPTSTSQYESIAKELYKKNSELVVSNQALAMQQKLYQIIVNSYDAVELSKRFINVITSDFKFVSGFVALHNNNEDQLHIQAITTSVFDQSLQSLFSVPSDRLLVPSQSLDNLLLRVYQGKKQLITQNLLDVFGLWISREKQEQAMQVAAASNIQAIFISPILFGSEILGVYVLFSERKEGEFSSYESAVLSETGNIFGLALNRVALYQDLQNANNKLTELDARKDEFLNIAAHELRAPMTAIKGYLSMISEGDAGELSIQLKDFVDEAILGNDRLIRLVNNMLNISRIEEGRQTFEMGQSPLGIVAKTVIDEYMAQAEEKHLQLLFEKSDTVKDIVYVDKDRIYEVVSNFISNAIKYTDQGHIVVRLSNPNSTRVRVEVIDTGPGLSTEDSSKLFQKFYRAQSSAGKQMGTGLGLYVSKLLVEKFGGTIGFQSELGKGSTFWFELPLVLQ